MNMTNNKLKKMVKKAEELGWCVNHTVPVKIDCDTVTLTYSKVIEDFFIELSPRRFYYDLVETYEMFDVDEHVRMWCVSDDCPSGYASVPSVEVLLNEAKCEDKALEDLCREIAKIWYGKNGRSYIDDIIDYELNGELAV